MTSQTTKLNFIGNLTAALIIFGIGYALWVLS